MDRQVTPPSRVTWPTWGPPPPCKQSLRFDQISPRSHKKRRVLGEISFISPKCLSSRRDLVTISSHWVLSEISFISQKSLSSRLSLGEISSVSRPRSLSSRADLRDITNLAEFSSRSLSSRRDLVANSEITNLAEISVKFLHGNCREFSQPLECLYIRICKQRKKVFYCFYKISFPAKKSKTLFFKILIKTQILTSREVLYTKLVRVISPCFSKKMLSKIRGFLA